MSNNSTISPYTRAQLTELDAAARAELKRPLSPRELEITRWIARGLTNAEIARRLVPLTGDGDRVSDQTIKNHVSNILRKTGTTSRLELALMAIGRGWVNVADACAHVEARATEIRGVNFYEW